MNSFRRLTRSAFVRTISHARQPIRSFVVSKIVPVAMGAAAFGMGCMVGPPAFEHRTLSDDNPILLPLDPAQGDRSKGSHAEAAGSIDDNTNPKPAAYGAQLVQCIDQEMIGVRRLKAEERKKPSDEGQLELQRRLLRLKSLYDAVWALYMIDISHDPKVWKLLDRNAIELNQPGRGTATTRTLKKAQEATTAGDTRSLEAHIKEVIEENARRGRSTRPESELERFMVRVPAGSAVLSRLRTLQRVATEDTEESRLLVQDIMYGLWWVLEKKARELDGVVRK